MSSQDDGPEVVENDRNEANRSEVNRAIGCSLESSVDFPIVECSLSELSYCYCVDESNKKSAEIGRRKLTTSSEGVDFTTRQADMLSQLTTKQLLLLNRKPTLIDNLILRNRSALLQNQMEGRRSTGIARGKKPAAVEIHPPPGPTKPGRKKRCNSLDASSPAVKRLKKGSAEEGGGNTSDSSSSRNTSLDRITRSTALQDNAQRKKRLKKPGELIRFSTRHGATLRNGKKRVNMRPQTKILKNAIKSKLAAVSDRKNVEKSFKTKKKPTDITDSNSNVFVETEADSDKKLQKRKRSVNEGNENKEDPGKNNENPTKVVRKKRRKRDSMWIKKVKKNIKPNAITIDTKETSPAINQEEAGDKGLAVKIETPPNLDCAPPEEQVPQQEELHKDVETEPKMPVLECQIDDGPVASKDVDATNVVKEESEGVLESHVNLESNTEEVIKTETVHETSDEKCQSESIANELSKDIDENTTINSTDDDNHSLCLTLSETDVWKEDVTSGIISEGSISNVVLQESFEQQTETDEDTLEMKDLCMIGNMSESEVTHVILSSQETGEVEKAVENSIEKEPSSVVTTEEVSSSQLSEDNSKIDDLELSVTPVVPESEVQEKDKENTEEQECETDKAEETTTDVEDKVAEVRLADGPNDADSTSDVPAVLDEPSADDSFNELSLYLPIDELPTEDQMKGIGKESDNSCSSFANIADIVLLDPQTKEDTKQEEEEKPAALGGEKEKQLSSTEIELTLKDLSDITEREISKTDLLKNTNEEDSCKDSGIQLEEPFSSDKENSASSSFPEESKLVQMLNLEEPEREASCKSECKEKIEEDEEEKGTVNSLSEKIVEDPRTSAMKEAVLQALGLKSLTASAAAPTAVTSTADKPKRVQDSGYTGTLKAVIKLNRGGDKKSRTMVYRRSDDKTVTDKIEYKMICSEAQDMENATNGNEMGSYMNTAAKQAQPSPFIKVGGTQQLDSDENSANLNGSQFQGAEGAEADDNNGGLESNLVIPEKSSSFSIHPGRLCSDVCSYCFGKFGSLDTPCHVAQLKSEERQRKILQNEPHLTAESCLCDACYRYVDRRANCPNGAGGRTKARPKPPVSSICCVIKCKELATHTVKRKWLLKLKKSIINKLDIDLEKPGTMYYPLCTQHHYWVEYFTVCGICRKRLNRNHLYSLGSETDRLNLMLAEDGIPARLSDKLFLCKLCRYYSSLRLKYSDPLSIPPTNQPFYRSYRKKILVSLQVSVSDSEDEVQVVNKKKNRKSSCPDLDGEAKQAGKGSGGSASADSKTGGEGQLDDEMAFRGLATLLGDSPAEQQTRIQVKFGNVNIGTLSNLNIGQHGRGGEDRGSRRYMSSDGGGVVEGPHLPLSAHLDFKGPSTPDGSWERCISTIQFDKRTKKLWQDLQRPYGSQSSFLRHLVMLEKYWRSGYLELADGAELKAAKYINSVRNRLKAFEGTAAPAPPPATTTSTVTASSNAPPLDSNPAEMEAFCPVINTSEIEVTPVTSVAKPEVSVRQVQVPAVSCRPVAQVPTVYSSGPSSSLKRESAPVTLVTSHVRQSMDSAVSKSMKKTSMTIPQAFSRAKSLVRMVSPPLQVPSSPRTLSKPTKPPVPPPLPPPVEAQGGFIALGAPQVLGKGAPPPLLKIGSNQGAYRNQSYILSLGEAAAGLAQGGVRLLVPGTPVPRYPQPQPQPHPQHQRQLYKQQQQQFFRNVPSSSKPLKPILPKLPRALTVTQVSAGTGTSGPAITLHGSGITIEKQSGNSPVSVAILPPEKPSISVFREPMPAPD